MKKIAYLLTAVFAVSCLASCGGGGGDDSKYKINPDISGGSAEEKDAILNAINKKPIVMNKNGDTIKALAALSDASKMSTLKEDDGDYLRLTTKQVVGDYTVELDWSVDETSPYFGEIHSSTEDDYHKIVEIKYPGYNVEQVLRGTFGWTLKSASCGGAKVTNPQIVEYKVNIVGLEYFFKKMSVAQFNGVKEGEQTFTYKNKDYTFPATYDIVDYKCEGKDTYKPDIAPNPENQGKELEKQNFLLVDVPAKVFYKSPDGNWGLAADGKNVIELYTGSELNLKETEFPNLANEYIVVSGEAGRYHGNVQISFISKISKLEDKTSIAEPVFDFPAISAEEIAGWKWTYEGNTYDNQAVPGLVNSLRSVTGTLVAGSIKDSDGKAVTDPSALKNNRATFQLQVGDQVITVAYDYHADREGKVGVFNALKAALAKGGEMTIKGTMRYDNGRDKDQPFGYVAGNSQIWTIVPYLPEHIVTAA